MGTCVRSTVVSVQLSGHGQNMIRMRMTFHCTYLEVKLSHGFLFVCLFLYVCFYDIIINIYVMLSPPMWSIFPVSL